MKAEKLLHAIGKIKDGYVQEAAPDEMTVQRAVRDCRRSRCSAIAGGG